MFGLFGKKQIDFTTNTEKKLCKDFMVALKEIKRQRAMYCQNKGMSISAMGQDLAHIERKGKFFYESAYNALKQGKSLEETYKMLNDQHATTELDKHILNALIINK